MADLQSERPLKISVISPILNCADYLPRMIDSVIRQSGIEIEHLVLDAGSTDGGIEVLRSYANEYKNVKLIEEPDDGQSDAINKGVVLATHPLVTWINGDDFLEEGSLALACEALERNPKATMAYGKCKIISDSGETLYVTNVGAFDRKRLLTENNFIPQPGAVFRKSSFQIVGGLRKELHYCMDFDLWLRLSSVGEVEVIDKVLSSFMLRVGSKTTSQQIQFHAEHIKVARVHGAPISSKAVLSSAIFIVKHPLRLLATKLGLISPNRPFIKRI